MLLGPNYKRPDVPLPQTWRATSGETAEVVNTAWWEGFQDPDLDALIKQAIDANKDLLEATERVKEFEARLQIAGADKYPNLTYAVTGERRHYSTNQPQALGINQKPTQNDFSTGAQASWELDIWGRVRRSNESAVADLLASEYARHAVMLTVVDNVATSYFQLLALDQQLRLAKSTLKNRADALKLVNDRYKGGSSSKLAVLQAQSAVDEVWVTIPDLEHEIAALENAMSLLVGRNPGEIARSLDHEPALPPVPGGVPSDVLTRRPDVLEAEENLISANAQIGVAKAAFFPTFSLTGALGFASADLDTLADGSSKDASIGLGLLGPLFNFGATKGRMHQAEAYQRELSLKYLQTVQSALADVDDALVYNAKAAEIEKRGAEQVTTLTDLAKLAQVRYDGGQSDYLEVLTAERDLFSAQVQQVNRHRDSYLALISVYAAMGGGWMTEQDKLHTPAKPETARVQPKTSSAAAVAEEKNTPAAAIPADTHSGVSTATTTSQRHPQ
ncbi:MAG: TolC family protein [Proteobacteria bacterium]|nr:TolC family protein [Pseudomonadota bacterium]